MTAPFAHGYALLISSDPAVEGQGRCQPAAPPPAPDPLARYLQKVVDESNALLLTAMGGDASAGDEITLQEVYQALDATTPVKLTAQEKQQRKERMGRNEETRPLTALEAATQQRRLVESFSACASSHRHATPAQRRLRPARRAP